VTLPFTVAGRRLRIHPLGLFAVALYVFPYIVVAAGKEAFNASEFLVWALFATGLNLLWGHTGDLSFGHGMFFGWGAYTAGIASRHVTFVPFDLAAAAVVAMLVAWPLAKIIVRRATGIYFAMITLAIGEMFFFMAFRLTSITGGENGLGDIRLTNIGGIDLASNANFYYMVATVTFLCTLLAWRIMRSPFGQVCRAIQQNRARVPFLGFDTVRYRERAFVWSAGICGVAGGLSAFLFRHVAAETLRWTTTGQAVLMTMLGGLNSFFGPAAGAVVVKFMEAKLNTVTRYWPAYIGALFAFFVLVAPSGLAGLAQRLGAVVRNRFAAGPGTPAAPAAPVEGTAA
jgi:ABC-type branched-subunit amino acid transport system permease subunit